MCGRYNFSAEYSDEKMTALIDVMERKYPGQYKIGEIFPGDTAPGIISRQERIGIPSSSSNAEIEKVYLEVPLAFLQTRSSFRYS